MKPAQETDINYRVRSQDKQLMTSVNCLQLSEFWLFATLAEAYEMSDVLNLFLKYFKQKQKLHYKSGNNLDQPVSNCNLSSTLALWYHKISYSSVFCRRKKWYGGVIFINVANQTGGFTLMFHCFRDEDSYGGYVWSCKYSGYKKSAHLG